ncbi:MAG TPA: hypothetical protein VIG64_03240 [Actinomycetota bacterium]
MKNSKRLFVRAGVAAAVLFLLLPAIAFAGDGGDRDSSSPAVDSTSDAPNGDGIALESDAAQVAADVGLPQDTVREYLIRQESVGKLESSLAELNPSAFGGLFIEYSPSYRVVVLAERGSEDSLEDTVDAAASEDLAGFIEVETRGYTAKSLLAANQSIDESTGKQVTSLDIDITRGKVLVTTVEGAVPEVRRTIESLDLAVAPEDVEVVEARVRDDDSYGGLGLNSSGGNCTSGFSVRQDGEGSYGVIDAAHCPNSGVTLPNGNSITHQAGSWGGSQDVQWFTTPSDSDLNKIKWQNDGTTRSITSRTTRTEMSVGMAVCHYGRTTGYDCGSIVSKTYQPGATGSHSFNETFIRVQDDTTDGGDSGGPSFLNNSAFGIIKGHIGDNGDYYFMAQNYMSVLGIHVLID